MDIRAQLKNELDAFLRKYQIFPEICKLYYEAIDYVVAFQGDRACDKPAMHELANLAIDVGCCDLQSFLGSLYKNKLGAFQVCTELQAIFNRYLQQDRLVYVQNKTAIDIFKFRCRLRELTAELVELEWSTSLSREITDSSFEGLNRAMLILFAVDGDKESEWKLVQIYGLGQVRDILAQKDMALELALDKVDNTILKIRDCLTAAGKKDFPPAAQQFCDNLHELFNEAFKTLEVANVN
jgi:hypothetical protein